jgi:uncharacterized protein
MERHDPEKLIRRLYARSPEAMGFLLEHSSMVSRKALDVARRVEHLGPDLRFVEEAAMLHDIGIIRTNAPLFGCRGDAPYICHGVLGREMLEVEGLPRHSLVCERHVGVGLRVKDIVEKGFPLPRRDMAPESLEETIVCFADKFFSKDREPLREKPLEKVRSQIARYGADKLAVFDSWVELFGLGRRETDTLD